MVESERTVERTGTMFARSIRGLAGLCVLLLSSGCAVVPASVATIANTTVPVSVGPVQRIGSEPARAELRPARTFRVDATNLYRFNAGAGGGGTIHKQTEDAAVFDVAVEEALDECGACRVRIGEVFVGSHSAVLIGVSDDTHWTGADVQLYSRSRKSARK
jgi:hypothetical protein